MDYNVFVGASGGVPPLQFDLEWVDGIDDAKATDNPVLTKQLFGVDLDRDKGSFFGRPRASGFVDLTVRVYASVMNPTQDPPNGTDFLPTGGVDIELLKDLLQRNNGTAQYYGTNVLWDDNQIVGMIAEKCIDKDKPRVEIRLWDFSFGNKKETDNAKR